jgi:hypothetical protein
MGHQTRLAPRGGIGVNDPLSSRAIQLADRMPKGCRGIGGVGLRRRHELAHGILDLRLDDSIALPAVIGLTRVFLGS